MSGNTHLLPGEWVEIGTPPHVLGSAAASGSKFKDQKYCVSSEVAILKFAANH